MNLAGLRVAMVAGTLDLGGAEKQLVYIARALHDAGAEVRVYCPTSGEHYETELIKQKIPVCWFGSDSNPVQRTFALLPQLHSFHPHIVQSTHFFTNLYTIIGARFTGAIELGAVRSSIKLALHDTGGFGSFLLRCPKHLVVNSNISRKEAIHLGICESHVSYLSNVIDLEMFDQYEGNKKKQSEQVTAILVANCLPVKRIDRFLAAIALAKEQYPKLIGWVVGDGPERTTLEGKASALGLKLDKDIFFLGQRLDIPALLHQGDILCQTSESEGFPNVLLEGMAARLPVVAYSVGDANKIVLQGKTGYIVEQGVFQMTAYLIELAKDTDKRLSYGKAGRQLVETNYSYHTLASRLLEVYVRAASQQRKSTTVFDFISRQSPGTNDSSGTSKSLF